MVNLYNLLDFKPDGENVVEHMVYFNTPTYVLVKLFAADKDIG